MRSPNAGPVKVGVCGSRTVGGGIFNVLEHNIEEVAHHARRGIEVAQIATHRPNPEYDTGATSVTADTFGVACNPKVDVVVKLIGGYTLAHELVLRAIENGKHVVIANKALITVHSNEIFAKARKKGVTVVFEAAAAGNIPVIKAIRKGLSTNRVNWLAGIINDASNLILSKVREKGRTFPDMLIEAQVLGYAEADPTFDVEGIDAAHKSAILASTASGIPLQFDEIYAEGISKLTNTDVNYADALGYRIRYLGMAYRTESGFGLRVYPIPIPSSHLTVSVNGVMSVVMINGDAVSPILYYGVGAGIEPTTSSVMTGLADVVRAMTSDPENRVPHLALQPDTLSDHPILPIEAYESAYYLRIQARDHPGVLTQMATILLECGINIESIIQKRAKEQDGLVLMTLITHRVIEQRINDVITALETLEGVSGPVVRICVE